MNISYDWLATIVPLDVTPRELRDIITMRCATVDELATLRSDLADVVIGRVVEAGRHPDSDHLWVTKVDAGRAELLDVVCGAPNVQAGRTYPFAPAGSTLPGGLKLEKRKIRGAVSNGMLCSARELALGENHEGILEIQTDAPPGTPLLHAFPGLGDSVLVVDVTPVRPDLLSHMGIAREVAAATGRSWSLPTLTAAGEGPVAGNGAGAGNGAPGAAERPLPMERDPRSAIAGRVRVELEDAAGCPRYLGVTISGVKVGPSPDWLVRRLAAVGARPINNIVDVTNFLLHEMGQPMHAFDAGRLRGPAVVIRKAREGERITTLDGVERVLTPQMTVIADAERAQAIAGVMGGGESEVGNATTDIFLEVATFDAVSIRRTRRQAGMSTDASYRFERGTDIEMGPAALERAARLIVELAGGQVEGRAVDLYPSPRDRVLLPLRVERVGRLLGRSFSPARVAELLEPVGFEVQRGAGDSLTVTVPSWRVDVTQEVDLIEEVARLEGYENFSDELRPFRTGTVPDAPLYVVSSRVREALVGAGLLETRPMPFVKGTDAEFVRVVNPLAESEAHLRRDVLDTLARRAEHNLARMEGDVRLFEIGSVFAPPSGGSLPAESMRVGALIMGKRRPPHWTPGEQTPPAFDEWDAKGLAELIARTAEPGAGLELRPATGGGDALWEILLDGNPRGVVRRVPLDAPVWASPAFGVELTLASYDAAQVAPPGRANYAAPRPAAARDATRYRHLPTTPASEFDLALLVPNEMPASRVEAVIRSTAGDLLERLELFDEYRGAGVPEGQRSLAWRLTFRHPARTLQAKEIGGRRERLLRTLEGELGVRQRTS